MGFNSIAISLGLIFIIITVASLLGRFFDVEMYVYMPFMIWFVALCIFNIFLEKNHVNIFMKEIKESQI
jgi:hypothetical protein